VTDAATGTPIPGVTITAGRGVGITNANGDYSIRGLPTDAFTVLTRMPRSSGHIDQLYDGIRCWWERCDRMLGTQVKVNAPETTTRIDFRLQRGAQISGTVTNAATGAPVAGVSVGFQPALRGDSSATPTDAQGRYISTGLLPGSYYVHTDGPDQVGMLNQVYPGKPIERHQSDLQSGTPVAAVAGSTTGGIDFALIQGGSISGVVTETATGEPVRGVRIEVRSPSAMSYGVTDPNGRYSVAGLRTGSYRVTARPAWEGILSFGMKHGLFLESLLGQVYVAKGAVGAERDAGTPVVVTAPGAATGIDFALVQGGVITGTVLNARTGEPVVGIRVDASGERASGHGTTDERGRYEITGLAGGRHALFTSSHRWINSQPPLRVLGQVYQGPPCWNLSCPLGAGTAVSVSAGLTVRGVDFSLAEGGVISGVVTNAPTGKPVAGARVHFYSSTGDQIDWVRTNANGRYASGGLPTGTYLAVAAVEAQQDALVPQV
jgi:5-hydroxyisourate hydrolase-like protein (transthyretin family)